MTHPQLNISKTFVVLRLSIPRSSTKLPNRTEKYIDFNTNTNTLYIYGFVEQSSSDYTPFVPIFQIGRLIDGHKTKLKSYFNLIDRTTGRNSIFVGRQSSTIADVVRRRRLCKWTVSRCRGEAWSGPVSSACGWKTLLETILWYVAACNLCLCIDWKAKKRYRLISEVSVGRYKIELLGKLVNVVSL